MTDLLIGGALRGVFGSGKGRRRRAQKVRSEWEALGLTPPGQGQDPRAWFDSAVGGLDELGYSAGLPGSHIAPDVQYLAEARAARRNLALARQGLSQGMAALRQGTETLSSYRPGGAAALTSGLYQSQADLAFRGALAQQQEAPDLMFYYDKQVRQSAEDAAGRSALTSSIFGLAGTAVGAVLGGGGGGSALGGLLGGATQQTPGGPGTNVYSRGLGGGQMVGQGLVPGQQHGPLTAGSSGDGQPGMQGLGGWQGPPQAPGPQGSPPGPQTGRGTRKGVVPGPGAGAAGPAGGGAMARFGDTSAAVGPVQAGISADTGTPSDVMRALIWQEQAARTRSTADTFERLLAQLLSPRVA